MNILSHLSSGASKSFRSWKWILVIWFAVLVLVSILGLTLRGELNAIFGKSMITEKLADGTIVDVIANAGTGMRILISSFTTGFFLITFLGILVIVFFNGGLFTVLRTSEAKTGSTEFFGGAASNFWPFLVIWLLIALMIAFAAFLLVGLPVVIRAGSNSAGSPVILKLTSLVLLLIMPVFLLVADYARAWQVSNERKNAFKAIGKGFATTFRHFFLSWSAMFLMIVIQVIYLFLVFRFTGSLKPVSAGGIFLLFILIQVLFIIKLFLRTWRYGIVTSLYEKP